MRRAVTRDMLLNSPSSESVGLGCDRSMFRENVERVGDFPKLELILPLGPWPRENVERAGEGGWAIFGRLWEFVIPPIPPTNTLFRYLSPGSSALPRGRQSFCSVPSKSVGARMVRRAGKPLKKIDFPRMSVALSSSGLVISQCR